MKNPAHRELMAQLYRWFEKYENPPKNPTDEEMTKFFQGAWAELDEIIQKVQSPWTMRMCIGFYEALEDAYKVAQRGETNVTTC
jgi:hypothetical protein